MFTYIYIYIYTYVYIYIYIYIVLTLSLLYIRAPRVATQQGQNLKRPVDAPPVMALTRLAACLSLI